LNPGARFQLPFCTGFERVGRSSVLHKSISAPHTGFMECVS